MPPLDLGQVSGADSRAFGFRFSASIPKCSHTANIPSREGRLGLLSVSKGLRNCIFFRYECAAVFAEKSHPFKLKGVPQLDHLITE